MPPLRPTLPRNRYTGPCEPTLAVLHEMHRHHAWHIPYESLDAYRQCPVTQDIDTIFDNTVIGRRGGWCYEMNGLLAWALAELGFAVTRQVGAVQRSLGGDVAFGNHLVLKVTVDGAVWLADVGSGDGIAKPLFIRTGRYDELAGRNHREFGLARLPDGIWRVTNAVGAIPPDADFRYYSEHDPFVAPLEDEALISATSEQLQTDPD